MTSDSTGRFLDKLRRPCGAEARTWTAVLGACPLDRLLRRFVLCYAT